MNGEIVYIKEAWATEKQYNHLKPREVPNNAKIFYLLDGYDLSTMGKKRSPLFLPEKFARYFVKILGVSLGRLGSMVESDAHAEGVDSLVTFMKLWDSINKNQKWDTNPFCWRIEFEEVEKPK